MSPRTFGEVKAQLQGALIAATPIPFDCNGNVHVRAQESYVRYMATQPINGVAVWAHTGRGLMLDEATACAVLTEWRDALPHKLVVAGVGARGTTEPADGTARTLQMAENAARLGADALLVYPPTWLREHPTPDQLILEHHQRLAEIGLPLILFYLYEAAGGVSYSSELLNELLSLPEVVAIKMATLDSVMTFQDVAHQIRSRHPEKTLVTGEDRFFGYSLRCGADAALVGMGAVCCELQAELIRSHVMSDAERFLMLSNEVDTLGRILFANPIEGYIRRLLWTLVHQDVIPLEAAYDPWGPELMMSEFDEIGATLAALPVLQESSYKS